MAGGRVPNYALKESRHGGYRSVQNTGSLVNTGAWEIKQQARLTRDPPARAAYA